MHNIAQKLFNLPGITGKVVAWRKGQAASYVPTDRLDTFAQYEGKVDWYFGQTTQNPALAGKRCTNKGAVCLTHLWLDIDVAGKNEKYPTVDELRQTMDAFPFRPSIFVDSGRGYHSYWMLDRPYDAQENLNTCKRFQQLFVKYLQKVNPNRALDSSGDLARVLRIPGTVNSKADKPVKVLLGNDTRYALANIKAVLDEAGIYDKGASKQKTNDKILESMGAIETFQSTPPSIHDIAKECKQVGELLKTGGKDASEPLWYTSLGVAQYTVEKEEAAKMLSKDHPGYAEDLTLTKMGQWTDAVTGPATCEKFKEVNPNGCAGCQHAEVITTPVQLEPAQKIEIDPTPVNTRIDTEVKPIPFDIPRPFVIGDDKKLKVLVDIDDTGKKTFATLYDNEILPVSRIWDEQEEQEFVTFKAHLPKDGWRKCEFPTSILADQHAILKAFAGVGVAILPDMYRWFVRYVVSCVNAMQRSGMAQVAHSKMGWQDDGSFVLSDRRFTEVGVIPGRVSPSLAGFMDNIQTKGTKEGWARAFNVLCEQSSLTNHNFAIFVAFAVPLMKALDFPGLIYHLYSSKSSVFKTFYLKVVSSVYGKPEADILVRRDSEKSKYKIITSRCDLPTVYDEITNIDPKELSDFCYSVSQGRMHNRLNMDSTLRQNDDRWRTILLTSGNTSIHDALFQNRQAAFGEAMRVIEVDVTMNAEGKLLDSADAHTVMQQFESNYGVVGEEWIAFLTKNKKQVFGKVVEAYVTLNKSTGVKSSSRFWTAAIAAIWVAAAYTAKLGFHSYSMNFIKTYGLDLLNRLQEQVTEEHTNLNTPMAVLSEFIGDNMTSNAFVHTDSDTVIHEPKHQHSMRVCIGQYIYVSTKIFSEYCIRVGVDLKTTLRGLREVGIIKATTNKRLGLGEFGSTQRRCHVISKRVFNNIDTIIKKEDTDVN